MLTKEYNTLKFEKREEFGVLTVNRPKALNALNSEVHTELKDFLETLKSENDFFIKGLIVTGEGDKAFIAGADIKEMMDMSSAQATDFGRLGQKNTLLLEELNIPVVAAVNGFALGGGCEVAMSCDFIYATENAVFGQPEVKLGLIPGFGGSQRLSKLIGRAKAKEMMYTGRNMKAEEALSSGLVLKLFSSKAELIEGCMFTLRAIGKNSPLAVGVCKQVMNEGNDLTVAAGLEVEVEQFGKIFDSEDKREGTTAFTEKRKAVFSGK